MTEISTLALFLVVGSSGYKDMQERRIPNGITVTAIILGWLFGLVSNGFNGLLNSLFGSAIGLTIFLIPFALGGMGAGDVKLLAAIGSLMGWRFAVNAAIYSALVGGIMVLFYLVKHHQLKNTLKNIAFLFITLLTKLFMKYRFTDKLIYLQHRMAKNSTGYEKIYIPYGVAIAMGSLLVWVMENNLLLW